MAPLRPVPPVLDAYVFDVVRTPRAAARPASARRPGALSGVSPVALTAGLHRALLGSGSVAQDTVDAVLLGCATQCRDQGANIAKIAALAGGLGPRVSGSTVGGFCTSGLEAIIDAAARVASGMEALILAGGVEMPSRVPLFSDQGAWFSDPAVRRETEFVHMGASADLVAAIAGLDRATLDAYAVESHRRAAEATREGRFCGAIVPVLDAEGRPLLERDDLVREGLGLDDLARLPPAFEAEVAEAEPLLRARLRASARGPARVEPVHTVGTSPGLADGAALAVIARRDAPRPRGDRPRARIRAFASLSVDPVLMLTGNPPATREAARRAGIALSEVDLFEVNESFAAVPITFARELDLDPGRVNVNGGAIALGHPLGATGAVLLATLLDELERRGGTLGVVSIAGGAGLASAVVVERL